MATNWNIGPMRIARTTDDSVPLRNEAMIEEAGQSFSKYDPVAPDATDLNQLEVWNDVAALLCGLALHDASGVAGTPCRFEEIRSNCIMEANAINDGDGDADDAIAQTDINKLYGVKEHTDGNWVVDLSDTTNTRVRILGLAGMSEFGDYHARVEFIFLADYLLYENEIIDLI